MGVKYMQDVSWHIETLKKSDDDPRRHKSRCIHYFKGKCMGKYERCVGSAHCKYYKEIKEEDKNIVEESTEELEIINSKQLKSFELKNVNNEIKKYEVGKNIRKSDFLYIIVKTNKVGARLSLEDGQYIIVSKN